MKIGLSTSVIQRGKTGIGEYVFSLVRNFEAHARAHQFVLFVLEEDLPLFEFAKSFARLLPVAEKFRGPLQDILWHQLVLPRLARAHELDVLHVPSYRRLPWPQPCALVATIHDLAVFHITQKYDWARLFYGRSVARWLVRRQHEIIAISETTARDMAKYWGLPEQQVTVIHHGVDLNRFFPVVPEIARATGLKHFGLSRPFFLYVARLEHPAKNHLRLIEAFEDFKAETKSPWQLVLAGSDWHGAGQIHETIHRSPLRNDIRSLGFVAAEDLPLLYRAAQVFVYPSLYEGFGFPPLEAMASGCPVLCSRRGALGEVVGEAAVTVEPDDVAALKWQMTRCATDEKLRESLRAAGLERARQFDWQHAAAQTLEVYERAVAKVKKQAQRGGGGASLFPAPIFRRALTKAGVAKPDAEVKIDQQRDQTMKTKRTPWLRQSLLQTRWQRGFVMGATLLLAVCAPTQIFAQTSVKSERILVKPKPGVDLSALERKLGVKALHQFPRIGKLQILQVPSNTTADLLIASLQQSGLVQYAEHDARVSVLLTPNDFYYNDLDTLWGLDNEGLYGGVSNADIHAPEAWNIQCNASNVIVAVIDTGVRYTHEDLASNMWANPVDGSHGINTVDNGNPPNDPNDDYGHGTHVAGIIGAVGNNSIGVVGVAWSTQIMACKFLDSNGDGTISDAITCIDYAATNGAQVINASWGATTFTSQSLYDTIDSLRPYGVIFVAACGNSDEDNGVSPIYPASYNLNNIISVAATDRNDQLASFSNFGATNVGLGAPGVDILSCYNGSDTNYETDNGTSMAAAYVSGACTIMRAYFTNDNYLQIISQILGNVDPVPALQGQCISNGRLNLYQALSSIPPPPGPVITNLVWSGTSLVIQGTNGAVNGPFVLLSSTNLVSLPSQWTPVLTNTFDVNGNFNLTNLNVTNTGQFFVLSE